MQQDRVSDHRSSESDPEQSSENLNMNKLKECLVNLEENPQSYKPRHYILDAKDYGVPQEVKMTVSEDQREPDNWIVTYQIPNQEGVQSQIKTIQDVVRRNKHLSTLCRFIFEIQPESIKVTVFQENNFSAITPSKGKMRIAKFIKHFCKAAAEIIEDPKIKQQKPQMLFSERAVTIKKKLIKVNLIQGFLENKNKEKVPVCEHIANLLKATLQNHELFKQQIDSNRVLKEAVEHFLTGLNYKQLFGKQIYKQHPLFMDAWGKIRLINEAKDFNKLVFSRKLNLGLNQAELKEAHNLFIDWTEYHAYSQRIDNNEDSLLFIYNWLKPQLKDLAIKFNVFKKSRTEGTRLLREDKFSFHLQLLRNLVYHCNDYHKECNEVFKSIKSDQILNKLEQMYPRFVTFVYDFQRVQRHFFDTIILDKKYELLNFTKRNDDPKIIMERQLKVFNEFNGRYLKPYLQRSKESLMATEKIGQLCAKSQFKSCGDKAFVTTWAEDVQRNINLLQVVINNFRRLHPASQTNQSILTSYVYFIQMSQLGRYEKDYTQDKQWAMVDAYRTRGGAQNIYSCLNITDFDEDRSQLIKATREAMSPRSPYRPQSSFSNRNHTQPPQTYKPRPGPPRIPPHFEQPKQQTCIHYLKGFCIKHGKCRFSHPTTCEHYLKGTCRYGDQCLLYHCPKLCPKINFKNCHNHQCKKMHLPICRYFLNQCCERGVQCKNYHPPVNVCDRSKKNQPCTKDNCNFYHLTDAQRHT